MQPCPGTPIFLYAGVPVPSVHHNACVYAIAFASLLPGSCLGQTPSATSAPSQELSPKAAYRQAMHPLELTRQFIANWSDTEVSALTVSIAQGAKECAARHADAFTGAELLDLAKLCGLGQNFPAVIDATSRYIAASGPKPLLAQAYAQMIDAQLHTKDEAAALTSSKAMLTLVPYDSVAAATINEALAYMQFVHTSDALSLALLRQPLLLLRLRTLAATPPTTTEPTTAAADSEPPQSVHELYADGIALAALEQLSKAAPTTVAATLTALENALPATLSPDDAIPMARERRRYALLGQPLLDLTHPTRSGKVVPLTSLLSPPTVPQLPAHAALTGLLLFPDWCAQCIRMAGKLPETVFTVAGREAYLYGLLAPTVAQTPQPTDTSSLPPATPTSFTPAGATNLLRGTPTLVVAPSLLEQFAVNDVPFFILADSSGIMRVLQPVSDDALAPGGTIDSAIARVGAQWPGLSLPPSPPATPSTPANGVPSAAAKSP